MIDTRPPYTMTRAEWERAWSQTQTNYSGCGGDASPWSIARTTTAKGAGRILQDLHARQEFLKMGLPDIVVDDDLRVPPRWSAVIAHALSVGLPVPQKIRREYRHVTRPFRMVGK